jgi:uncharacterized coiled-coil protein SlyX
MYRTLSMNCGSVDGFQVSTKCGLSPNARQIREIADCDIPGPRRPSDLQLRDQDGHRTHRPVVGTLFRMPAPNELEARVAALETQVAELAEQVRTSKQDAAAARVLAGGADRDVTEIRGEIRDLRQATTSSFNAMRDDLRDLRRNTADGFTEMRGKLDATAAGQQQIVALLNRVLGEQDKPGGQ